MDDSAGTSSRIRRRRSVAAASSIEAGIAETAARQHGVVTRTQLREAGLPDDAIRSRLRAERLLPLHQGVYILGSLVDSLCPPRHREMAAALACGRGAAVSHRSALWLLDLLPARPAGPVHLVLRSGRCRRAGVVAHRVASLPPSDVDEVAGIPITTTIRSILDVAAGARPRELEQIIARAERLDHLDVDALRDRVKREKGRPGVAILGAILTGTAAAFTRSAAEERFLDLVRKAGLPQPELNVVRGSFELDVFWADWRVAIEIDGFACHASRSSFERDRERDLNLGAQGIVVHRVTWRQIVDEPFVLIRRLAAILARAEVRVEMESTDDRDRNAPRAATAKGGGDANARTRLRTIE